MGALSLLYLLALGLLAGIGLHRLSLVALLRARPPLPAPSPPGRWPRVTVQLPVYEEPTVVARLIDAVAALDYPRDLLEVQVLDDSGEAAARVAAERVAAQRAAGLEIVHLRRGSRAGYKAGALQAGLAHAGGELIAVFDADFVPPRDFLRRTVPCFRDAGLGLVQARWGHLNRAQSLLTRVQALALDAHFRVEQEARSRAGLCFNFNGTAGVLRRTAIEAAGGWSADTITEDLDLSVRMRLCGWGARFLDDLVVPAELPASWGALRQQQARWTRGSARTARKLLGRVWRAPGLAWRDRLEASAVLCANAAWPLLLLLALLGAPLGAAAESGPAARTLHLLLVLCASGAVGAFTLAAATRSGPRAALAALPLLPALFAVGLGLSLSNGRAWLAGWLGGAAPFARTPKQGAARARPRPLAAGLIPWAEAGLGLWALGGAGLCVWAGRWPAAPWLLLVALGFLTVALGSLREALAPPPPRAEANPPASQALPPAPGQALVNSG